MGATQSVEHFDHCTLMSCKGQNMTEKQMDAAFLNKENALNIMPVLPVQAKTKPTKHRNKCSRCSFNCHVDGQCPMCGIASNNSENQMPNQCRSSSDFDLRQPVKTRKKKRPSLSDLQGTMKGDASSINASCSESALSTASETPECDGLDPEVEDTVAEQPPAQVVSELNQKFPHNDGWRFLTRRVDTRTGTVVVHVNNKKTGRVGRFVQGATTSKSAARASVGAAHHAMQVVLPMLMSERAAKVASFATAKAEQIQESLLQTVAHAKEVKKRLVQERVEELMASHDPIVNPKGLTCDKIVVDLYHDSIVMKEQVKFEGGKAVIKPESSNLMEQIGICKKAISKTCTEFQIPNMSWRVEGHTAVSKKSTDGGMATSEARANAVCAYLGSHGIDVAYLKPVGCGCFQPPKETKADPRRVEIHVM